MTSNKQSAETAKQTPKRWLRHSLDRLSQIKYGLWRSLGSRRPLQVKLTAGPSFILRPPRYGDLDAAYEVWTLDIYSPPIPIPPNAIRSILDLGSNSGHSCLYWSLHFPGARLVAVEPHPGHAATLRNNLQLNGLSDRMTVIEAAAGTKEGEGLLTDAGTSSSLNGAAGHPTIPVRLIDVFNVWDQVDLLKIDIEGSEYELLQDNRFFERPAKYIVMEVHEHANFPDGHRWCAAKLEAHGFKTVYRSDHGLLWAMR